MDSIDYENLSNNVGIDVLSCSSSSISTVSLSEFSFKTGEDGSSQNPQECSSCSMSLSSLMHTENLLQKQLPVVHGGSHVEFTKKDLMRIKDPDVLEFFERNSSIFGKYMKKTTSKSENEISMSNKSFLATISAVDVQKSIHVLQQEIDTFITAVDNEGKKYNIELNASGTLQVPISDCISENNHHYTKSLSCIPHPVITFSQDFTGYTDGAPPVSVEDELLEKTESLPPFESVDEHENELLFSFREQKATTTSHSSSPRSARKKTAIEETENEKAKHLSFFSKRKNDGKVFKEERHKKAHLYPGRIHFDLSPNDDARVSELLSSDGDVALNREENPFLLPKKERERLSQIENSLSTFRRIRKVLSNGAKETIFPILKKKHPNSSENAQSSSVLGKMYMDEVSEKNKMQCALNILNAKLIAYQQESEALSLELSQSVAKEVCNLRPSWAQNPIQLALDNEVTEMIQQAKVEEEESGKYIHQFLRYESRSPDTSFFDRLKTDRMHAELLLEKNTKEPLKLTAFSFSFSDQSSRFFETEEVPPNIRADLLDVM